MEKHWTDAERLYVHFLNANGGQATLKFIRWFHVHRFPFTGVPGTEVWENEDGRLWVVPGYKCLNCGKIFFVAEREQLKHGCCNDGGVISEMAIVGTENA
jgi:hypothetical protein